jgi:hypothetical protein
VQTQQVPSWLVAVFAAAIAFSFARGYIQDYVDSHDIGGRMICSLTSQKDVFANVEWDQLCYIPRMNAAAAGRIFSDPWNSHNPAFSGWGSFGLFPAVAGGLFLAVFDDLFLALSVWSLLNFSLISLVGYAIFRAAPFGLSRAAALVAVCFLVHFPWISVQPFQYYPLMIFPLLGSPVHSQTDIEAGLFTYLPLILFLFFYWRFVCRPAQRNAAAAGAAAGFLTYVYYFHYIFAFAMLASHALVMIILRKNREALLGGIALLAGISVAIPFFINSGLSAATYIAGEYLQRLAYEPGASPLADYRWLAVLWLPAMIGFLYWRQSRYAHPIVTESFVTMAIAFCGVLSLRAVMGFGVATDHYWRQSLAIPATLWSTGVVACLWTSREWPAGLSKLMRFSVMLLPFLIFVRTGSAMLVHFQQQSPADLITAEQGRVLAAVDCLDSEDVEGQGFMSSDTALNYLAMVNLRMVPFVPTGLSPASLETITERYLMSMYLTGRDVPRFTRADRVASSYVHAQDPELYLYVNLFRNLPKPERDGKIQEMYETWNSETFDWSTRGAELGSVKIVYVDGPRSDDSLKRLSRFYDISNVKRCVSGASVIRVSAKQP